MIVEGLAQKQFGGIQFHSEKCAMPALNISMSAMNIGAGMSISNSYSMLFVKHAGSIYPVRT